MSDVLQQRLDLLDLGLAGHDRFTSDHMRPPHQPKGHVVTLHDLDLDPGRRKTDGGLTGPDHIAQAEITRDLSHRRNAAVNNDVDWAAVSRWMLVTASVT